MSHQCPICQNKDESKTKRYNRLKACPYTFFLAKLTLFDHRKIITILASILIKLSLALIYPGCACATMSYRFNQTFQDTHLYRLPDVLLRLGLVGEVQTWRVTQTGAVVGVRSLRHHKRLDRVGDHLVPLLAFGLGLKTRQWRILRLFA